MTVPCVITPRPACIPMGARYDAAEGVLTVDRDWWDRTDGLDPVARVMLAMPILPLGEALDLRARVRDGHPVVVRWWAAPPVAVAS